MSRDNVADILNQIVNAKKADKLIVQTRNYSKLLLAVLEIMKEKGHLSYELKDGKLIINIMDIMECKAIKPRFSVNKNNLDKYIRRFLPSRNFGHVIISTDKGLMDHKEAQENKKGGCLIAYFY